jgi:hypothetical protein
MQAAVRTIRKFQTVALVTTAGAVGYFYLHDGGTKNFEGDSVEAATNGQWKSGKQGHTLTGELVDKDKQVVLPRLARLGHP